MLEYGSQPLRFHANSVIINSQNYLIDDANKLIVGKHYLFLFFNISCEFFHPF